MLISAQHKQASSPWARNIAFAWLAIVFIAALFGGWFIELFGLPVASAIDSGCMGGCSPTQSSTSVHLLGTDSLGRDVLSQLIGGARTALFGGVAASGLSFLIGYSLGSWSAWFSKTGDKLSWLVLATAGMITLLLAYVFKYYHATLILFLLTLALGGVLAFVTIKYSKSSKFGVRTDRLLLFVAEVFSSVPALLLLLALAAMAFRPGLIQLVLIYVFVRWTKFAVLAQQEVKAALASPYVQTAYHAGVSKQKVLWKHILPNTFGTLWVQALLGVSAFIIIEGTFSFLGLGLPVEQASWGRLVSEARSVSGGWWLWVLPGLVLSATILSLQYVGNSFRQNQ